MDALNKSILFVTGKGGVGKTTVSLALGRRAAAAGKRTVVCELAGLNQAAEILGTQAQPYAEVDAGGGLWTFSIDPENATREYLEHRLPVKAMSGLLQRSRLFTYLAAATPGLAEMVAMGKVWELAGSERRVTKGEPYDLVIVDAPATGHGVGFLETPANFADIARVGPLAEQASVIARAIRNPRKSGVVVVATAEEMAVSEALELEQTLKRKLDLAVGTVIANAIQPQHLKPDELDRLAGLGRLDRSARSALDAVISHERRAEEGRAQLERLRAGVSAEVHQLPMLFEQELGADSISKLAEALA